VSKWRSVLSGVPQGSVLGPLLFVLCINDSNDSVSSKILKFADDTKIFIQFARKRLEETLGQICVDYLHGLKSGGCY